ncbi:MAG: hypothetical protein ISS36_02675 [Candidatus Aenigmarchaeota archaeon]|nr:hypothetical protein [Candidatus Aenigmarchaeota archaeon]
MTKKTWSSEHPDFLKELGEALDLIDGKSPEKAILEQLKKLKSLMEIEDDEEFSEEERKKMAEEMEYQKKYQKEKDRLLLILVNDASDSELIEQIKRIQCL